MVRESERDGVRETRERRYERGIEGRTPAKETRKTKQKGIANAPEVSSNECCWRVLGRVVSDGLSVGFMLPGGPTAVILPTQVHPPAVVCLGCCRYRA